MRKLRPLGMFASGAVVALVITGGGVAYAANGGALIIGHKNHGSRLTTLSSGHTPLKLTSRHGPALAVNNQRKVLKLNADKLDGLTSADFARVDGTTGHFTAPGVFADVDEDTVQDTILAEALCPPNTQLTGGGIDDFTSSGVQVINAPNDDNSGWLVAVADDPSTGDLATDVTAYAVCYSPRGRIAGSVQQLGFQSAKPRLTASERDRLRRAVEAKTR